MDFSLKSLLGAALQKKILFKNMSYLVLLKFV